MFLVRGDVKSVVAHAKLCWESAGGVFTRLNTPYPMNSRRIKTYTPPRPTKIALLWAHGGTFTDGDERYDAELLQRVSTKANVVAVAVNFRQGPLSPWPLGLYDLECEYHRLKHEFDNVYVGGTSSGGFFAYALASRVRAPKCALLCPVLEPIIRQISYPGSNSRRRKQLSYYGTTEQMETITSEYLRTAPAVDSVLVIRGGRDTSAPERVALPSWLRNVREHVIPSATHQLCSHPTDEVVVEVVGFLRTG
jgi:acetyl esterase/lipase